MDPPPPALPESNPQTILFRPTKKRKIYRRQRDSESSFDNDALPAPAPEPITSTPKQTLDELITSPHGTTDESVEGVEVPIAEVLRLRKQRQRGRIGGVEFRASAVGVSARGGNDDDGEDDGEGGREIAVRGEGEVAEVGQVRKFAPQTGMIGDVSNKHMMAYIDSELAKRSSIHNSTTTTKNTNAPSSITSTTPAPPTQQQKPDLEQANRQPATLGKLQEIDLGDEARDRNVQRTNQAWRRLAGEEIDEDEEGKDGNPKNGKKIRLGRDGKPWRGGRKRRASEDIKRDQLVEAILRENRLEIYDEPVIKDRTANDDQAADDRIAEEFRREFMDAVQQRQTKKAAPAPTANRGKVEEELMKGPKLGGSRQARAAMRESMLKNVKK